MGIKTINKTEKGMCFTCKLLFGKKKSLMFTFTKKYSGCFGNSHIDIRTHKSFSLYVNKYKKLTGSNGNGSCHKFKRFIMTLLSSTVATDPEMNMLSQSFLFTFSTHCCLSYGSSYEKKPSY